MTIRSEDPANRLDQVLALDGPEFLGQAYLLMLGRPVDPEGYRNYDAQLRAGTSKLSIMAELRASQEGRAYGSNALAGSPSDQLREILALDGAEFLGQAYLLMLGRPIDPEGYRNYDAQLRAGTGKLSILVELRASPEGQAYGGNSPDPLLLLAQSHVAIAAPAASLHDLLLMSGSSFVTHGFIAAIGRMPDEGVRRRYVAKLNSGTDKLQILLEILETYGGASSTPAAKSLELSVRSMRGGMYPVAANIRELLALDDVSFIDCAYKTLLKRAPDAVGVTHYLQLIRTGASKMRIIMNLCFSAEGRKQAPSLPGLKRGMLKYWLARSRLTGWWFRPIAQTEGDTPMECRLRAIESTLMRLAEERERESGEMEASVDDVAQLMKALIDRQRS
jgi:hypothetical protein